MKKNTNKRAKLPICKVQKRNRVNQNKQEGRTQIRIETEINKSGKQKQIGN